MMPLRRVMTFKCSEKGNEARRPVHGPHCMRSPGLGDPRSDAVGVTRARSRIRAGTVHSAAWRHKIRPSSSSSVRGKIPAYADFHAQPPTGYPMRHALPAPEIFKAYDIRGIADTVL